MRYTFKELDPTLLSQVATHIKDVLYPERKYLGRKITPIVLLKDGRTIPLLSLLAKLKYGTSLDLTKQIPIWKDTNWYNATLENVDLLEIPDPKLRRAGRPPKYNIGVPSDHPEYHQRYMELTRERQREYRRKRYVSMRNAQIELLDNPSTPVPSTELATNEPDNAESMSSRLDDILLATKVASAKPKEVPTPKSRPPVRWSDIQSSDIPSQFSKEFLEGIMEPEKS